MEKMPGEIDKQLEKLLKKLIIGYSPEQVILFGSYAYGNPHSDSDLDLLIIKNTSKRFIERWTEVRRILSDPDRTFPLETFVLTPQEVKNRLAVGDQFVAEILEKGRVLYVA